MRSRRAVNEFSLIKRKPNPWVRIPMAVILAITRGAGGLYLALHATTLDDKATVLAKSNVHDILLTLADPAQGEWATARVAARDVAFQEDSSCEVIQEEILTGNNIATAQMRAQAYIDLSLSGTTSDVRAEYGEGYWIIPGLKQTSGDNYRFLPDRFVALVVVIHCAPAPQPSGPSGVAS
jgi:hypothetical protein